MTPAPKRRWRPAPELRMVDAQVGAARAARRLAVSQLLPTVAAQASYAYSDGSRFQEKETRYVGGVATWNFWEWGSSRFQVDAAAARLARARVGREQTADLIRLEVRQADLKLKEARESLAVASASIAAAEEALRIEWIRFDQRLSTSTDVLDAESLHTAASMRQTTAQYQTI